MTGGTDARGHGDRERERTGTGRAALTLAWTVTLALAPAGAAGSGAPGREGPGVSGYGAPAGAGRPGPAPAGQGESTPRAAGAAPDDLDPDAGADQPRPDAGAHRDPFVGVGRPDPPAAPVRPRGLAGVAVADLRLRGLVRRAGAYVALIEDGRGRSHLLRGGEQLFDGAVQAVTAHGVVIAPAPDAGAPAGPLTLRFAAEDR